ncbi:hypothetical protein M0R88_13035 [Halorussus gelatinilyticus]|uniref:Uncharacterized protein n=1 Tax=Halorussus gelatinilyticus TaxID=2937524 RepID=A0A8U0IGN3_9EURY|nr:hypothetical protein [Halorussus gelatinilyticus]UPV99443.1 hypothetical protein M0R88_13035 [Halorussus gelatinilyticus]
MIRGAIRTTVRAVGVVCLTVVEVTALSVWLGLVNDADPVSLSTLVGVVGLAAGMLVEALLAHVTVNGWGRAIPARTVAGLALAETALWAGWFGWVAVADGLVGVVTAGLAFAAALVARHTVADNVIRGRNALASLVQRATIGLAVLQAAGATAWLLVVTGQVAVPEWFVSVPMAGFSATAVVGATLLAAATFARHLLAVRHALRRPPQSSTPTWRSSRTTPRK